MKLFIGIWCCFAISLAAMGQNTSKTLTEKFSFAISGGNFFTDQGVTAAFTSPYFLDDKIAFRLTGSVHWMESYFAVMDDWVTFPVYQAGLTYKFLNRHNITAYADAGGLILFPDKRFSDSNHNSGYFGFLGIEVSIFHRAILGVTYFIEQGIMINNGRAEKLDDKPQFSNGFTVASGFRFHFYRKIRPASGDQAR